jgi:DNA-binding MarR family transcriptional regulator
MLYAALTMLEPETFATTPRALAEEVVELQRLVVRHSLSAPAWSQLQLTMPRLKALFSIACERSPTVGGLARALGVSLPTASTLVEALVAQGYASRREDAGDRRRTLVELTPAGESLVVELREGSSRLLHDSLERLDPEDLAALARGLRALARELTGLDGGGAAAGGE